jgi:sporulation protein YlmC with PRC-barrel domain
MNTNFLHHWYQKKVQNHNWEKLWFISGILFDREYEKIVGCIYKKWFLQYGYFLFEDIVTENRQKCIIHTRNHQKEFYEIIGKNVQNQDGVLLGYINDIDFDIGKNLTDIYVDMGYNISLEENNLIKKDMRKISKKAIVSYENDFIVIQDRQTLKENKKTLENISKIFINIPTPNYTINFKKYE